MNENSFNNFLGVANSNEPEIWKDIIGYEGLYQISNLGNVKSLSRILYRNGIYPYLSKEKLLTPKENKEGYLTVVLSNNGKTKSFYTRNLVAMAFLEYAPGNIDLVIKTKNNIKNDSRAINLEITTRLESMNKKHLTHSSQYTGVYFFKRTNKWMAKIVIDKKQKHLGYFKNEYDAHLAYQEALKNRI